MLVLAADFNDIGIVFCLGAPSDSRKIPVQFVADYAAINVNKGIIRIFMITAVNAKARIINIAAGIPCAHARRIITHKNSCTPAVTDCLIITTRNGLPVIIRAAFQFAPVFREFQPEIVICLRGELGLHRYRQIIFVILIGKIIYGDLQIKILHGKSGCQPVGKHAIDNAACLHGAHHPRCIRIADLVKSLTGVLCVQIINSPQF